MATSRTSRVQDDPHAEPIQPPGIELASIDVVPTNERHGEVSHLGALWFVGNINLTAMATTAPRAPSSGCRSSCSPGRSSAISVRR